MVFNPERPDEDALRLLGARKSDEYRSIDKEGGNVRPPSECRDAIQITGRLRKEFPLDCSDTKGKVQG